MPEWPGFSSGRQICQRLVRCLGSEQPVPRLQGGRGRLAVSGQTALEIAKRLFISDRTVETHLANAYIKLGVQSKFELARRADELGL